MKKFKEIREALTKFTPVVSPDQKKVENVPSNDNELDDAEENARNPEDSAESMVDSAIKPIYKKTKDGIYTLNTESLSPENKVKREASRSRVGSKETKVKFIPVLGKNVYSSHATRPHPENNKELNRAHNKRQAVGPKRKNFEEFEINENVFRDLQKIVSLAQSGTVKFADDSSTIVNYTDATDILTTHGRLNKVNQNKMAKELNASSSSFAKMQKFAKSQASLSDKLKVLTTLS